MNHYQTISRLLLAATGAAPKGRKTPYWLTQQRLLQENWLARVEPSVRTMGENPDA